MSAATATGAPAPTPTAALVSATALASVCRNDSRRSKTPATVGPALAIRLHQRPTVKFCFCIILVSDDMAGGLAIGTLGTSIRIKMQL